MKVRTSEFRAAVLLLLLAGACKGDATGPGAARYRLSIERGDNQFGSPGAFLGAPFELRVVDARTDQPARDVVVHWRLLEGPGGFVTPDSSATDSGGIATARLRLGPDTALFLVEAAVERVVGAPPVFSARAVFPPSITAVSPDPVAAGAAVTIDGQGFSVRAADNVVLFSGMRADVVSASPTRLEVTVPPCVPTRFVNVTAQLGPIVSGPHPLGVLGGASAPLDLQPGQLLSMSGIQDAPCLRLPGGETGLEYLLVPQNADEVPGRATPFRLVGLTGEQILAAIPTAPLHAPAPAHAAGGRVAAEWEAVLRERERRALAEATPRPAPFAPFIAPSALPRPGDRRTFNVITRELTFASVTAEVKLVTSRAIVYQDVNAPTPGFTVQDFEQFGAMFDDPIYPALVDLFGQPSDIDGNGRVIILFTPVVNEMTPRGSTGFVAGFFYGIDLLPQQQGSNAAEIFYSLVPDPEGVHSDPRRRDQLLRTVPPVLAHEFQHMIHFNQRLLLRGANDQEVLWLSEALAHAAEHVIADVYYERRDTVTADQFAISNFSRAYWFLEQPNRTSLVAKESPGTLEMRGAAWLFMHHLQGHYGDRALLRSITQTTRSGVGNVTFHTGRAWRDLLEEWAVAVWATGAPALAGVPMEPRHTYSNLQLRAELQRVLRTGFPLQPTQRGFADFVLADSIAASAAGYSLIRAGGSDPKPIHVGFFGAPGAPPGTGDRTRLSVLRVR